MVLLLQWFHKLIQECFILPTLPFILWFLFLLIKSLIRPGQSYNGEYNWKMDQQEEECHLGSGLSGKQDAEVNLMYLSI